MNTTVFYTHIHTCSPMSLCLSFSGDEVWPRKWSFLLTSSMVLPTQSWWQQFVERTSLQLLLIRTYWWLNKREKTVVVWCRMNACSPNLIFDKQDFPHVRSSTDIDVMIQRGFHLFVEVETKQLYQIVVLLVVYCAEKTCYSLLSFFSLSLSLCLSAETWSSVIEEKQLAECCVYK